MVAFNADPSDDGLLPSCAASLGSGPTNHKGIMQDFSSVLRRAADEIEACRQPLALPEEHLRRVVRLGIASLELPGAFPEHGGARARIDAASDDYQKLGELVAVLAPQFTPTTLEAMRELPNWQVYDAIAAGLVGEAGRLAAGAVDPEGTGTFTPLPEAANIDPPDPKLVRTLKGNGRAILLYMWKRDKLRAGGFHHITIVKNGGVFFLKHPQK